MNKEIEELNKKAKQYSEKINKVTDEVGKVIVGQKDVLKKVVISLIANGNVLVEGVPGLAKTLMISTLASTIKGDFRRIQFTPDLLPSDITGTKIFTMKTNTFKTEKGPIFSNFILADEINRAPPKVQSALLEAMQEKQVTIQGDTFKLERPFFVLATENPIESEGTYKLPEAQVDRFMMFLLIDYPNKEEEKEIIKRMTKGHDPEAKSIMSIKELLEIQKFNTKIYVDETIEEYVAEIVMATRKPEEYDMDFGGIIEYGASPRASIWLILGAKANALLEGRGFVTPDDVKSVAHEILRHRIILSYEGEAEGIKTDDIINKILDKIKTP